MNIRKTSRGFDVCEFVDFYNKKCSLQKSSIASEDCVWLGIDEPDVMACYPQHHEKITLPYNVDIFSKMHLTKDMVKKLIPLLQNFVDTGELR